MTKEPGHERIADLLAGSMTGAERESLEREILESDELAERLYSEVGLEEALTRAARTGERRVVPLGRGRTWWKIALPLAAAIALVAVPLALRNQDRPSEPTFRGDESGLAILEPRDEVDAVGRFVWHADPGASTYEVVVRDGAAREVWRATTTGTSVSPPPGSLPADLSEGTWTVKSIDADGFERESRTARFRMAP